MYGTRSNGNQHGIVLTKPGVVKDMLDSVNYISSINLKDIRITEPASGDGAFAVEILERLFKSSQKFQFDFGRALANLAFYEIDAKKSAELRTNIDEFLNSVDTNHRPNIVYEEDFLLADASKCDIIIGNPPYVRHEKIPDDLKTKYRKIFGTFKHRSDLYIPFFEKGLRILNNNGTLCYICSNRWLKNQYGGTLRNLIGLKYSVDWIIDLENANAFQESVIAYPSIIKINNSIQKERTRYYEANNITDLSRIIQGKESFHTELMINKSNWFINKPLNGKTETHLDLIENQGFKIGIGVATGCDRVFINNDFEGKVEEELLLPILMARDLKNDTFHWQGKHVINPFDSSGNLINLDKYPKARKYFSDHKEALKNRHVAKNNPNNWIKTIDKIKPNLKSEAKIILPDISGNKFIFIDEGNYYPHHNLYYITGDSLRRLKALASILLSDFVRHQLSNIGNKMNGGYPRWQSQYLKKLKIPRINSFPKQFIDELIVSYNNFDIDRINALIRAENIEKYKIVEGQLTMFDPKTNYGTSKKHNKSKTVVRKQ